MMKKNFTWLGALLILIGFFILAFTAWKFIQNVSVLFPNANPINGLQAPVFKALTMEGGRIPFFIDDSNELYFQDYQDHLVRVTLDEKGPVLSQLNSLPSVSTINWAPESAWGLMDWQNSSEVAATLGKIHKETFKVVTLREGAWGGSWTPDNKITFLQASDEVPGLWQMEDDGSKEKQLAVLTDLSVPSYTAWSKIGNRLLVQSAFGAAIFTPTNDSVIQIGFITFAKSSTWSPDGWMVAYRVLGEEHDTLWVANLDGGEQRQVYEGVFSQVNWLPDGRLVFFTPAKGGGAACWALDPLSGTQELLADSSIVIYKPVDHIAVSPKGDALAFQAQDQQIWLLSFSE
jgi:hypothetical protein